MWRSKQYKTSRKFLPTKKGFFIYFYFIILTRFPFFFVFRLLKNFPQGIINDDDMYGIIIKEKYILYIFWLSLHLLSELQPRTLQSISSILVSSCKHIFFRLLAENIFLTKLVLFFPVFYVCVFYMTQTILETEVKKPFNPFNKVYNQNISGILLLCYLCCCSYAAFRPNVSKES